ncbi:unnamed protein product, partial [Phaeothamnion confervicola]
MGDAVQATLDRQVPELQELRAKGVFGLDEIKAILGRRREFEYLLHRHEARRADFLRYIEYEMNLEALRKMRHRKLKRRESGFKTTPADFTCMRQIHAIFDRAVRKFPADLSLWLQYIDFAAQQDSSKALGRLFARVLQFHPRQAGLWVKAASYEFFHAQNAAAARTLMQRALRINPGDHNLWHQYFRLEWCFVQKLRGRREILGLEKSVAEEPPPSLKLLRGEASDDEEAADCYAADSVAEAATAVVAAESNKNGESGGTGAAASDGRSDFRNGAVPRAVYLGAIQAVPDDIGFRTAFLRICDEFADVSGSLCAEILATIARDFPDSEEAWEVRATDAIRRVGNIGAGGGDDGSGEGGGKSGGRGKSRGGRKSGGGGGGITREVEEACVATFEEAVAAVNTADMWHRYAAHLRRRLATATARGGAAEGARAARRLAVVLARAGPRSEALVRAHADLLLDAGHAADALECLRAGTAALPDRPALWLRRASLIRRVGAVGAHAGGKTGGNGKGGSGGKGGGGSSGRGGSAVASADEEACRVLRAALAAVPHTDTSRAVLQVELLEASLAAAAAAAADASEEEKAHAAFREAWTSLMPPELKQAVALAAVGAAYIEWAVAAAGTDAARAVFDWLQSTLVSSHPALAAVYQAAASAEAAAAAASAAEGAVATGASSAAPGDKLSKKRLRAVFEAGVARLGAAAPELWEAYEAFEAGEGQ